MIPFLAHLIGVILQCIGVILAGITIGNWFLSKVIKIEDEEF